MWQHDMEAFAGRWRAFGWHAIVVDGHDLGALLDAFAEARVTKGRPTMILARTIKGKGVSFTEGKEGWHGRAFKKGEELDRALAELNGQFVPEPAGVDLARQHSEADGDLAAAGRRRQPPAPPDLQAGRRGRDPRGVRDGAREAGGRRLARRRAGCRREELDLQRQVRESGARALLRELHRRAGDGGRGDGARGTRSDSVSVDVCLLSRSRRGLRADGGDQRRGRQVCRIARRACRLAKTGRPRWRSKIWRCFAPQPNITVLYPVRRGQHREARQR